MKIGLVLEGGGARGAYQVGAIKAFKDKGIKFDGVVGTSIGAINAAFVAMNDYRKMKKLWNNASVKKFLNIDDEIIEDIKNKEIDKETIENAAIEFSKILKNKGIDSTNLKNIIVENIDENKIRKSNIDFGLVTVKLDTLEPKALFKEDIPNGTLPLHVFASAYHPAFKYEKIIDDSYYLDGGFYEGCPINMFYNKGYDLIYVVRLHRYKVPFIKKDPNTKIIYIKSYKKLDSIIFFTKKEINNEIKLGYFDTLKVLDNLDGEEYYFTNRDENFYKLINKNNKMKLLIGKTNKEKTITVIEKLMKKYNFKKFKVYDIKYVILKLKVIIKDNDKYYNFIKNIKLF